MRIIKKPEERRTEILDASEELFTAKGYEKTTVADILQKIGMAKGSFYYYYKSKEEVMNAVVMRYITAGAKKAVRIAEDHTLSVNEKMLAIIFAQKPKQKNQKEVLEQLHQSDNAAMHQKSMTETLVQLSPILTEVVEQGIRQGVYTTPYPGETVEFLLADALVLFDDGLFQWEKPILQRKAMAFIHTAEILLGAESGSFTGAITLFDQLQQD